MLGYAAKAAQWQKRVGSHLINALLPPRCPLSDDVIARQGGITPEHWQRLTFLAPPWCEACGLPFPSTSEAMPLCVLCAAPKRESGRLTGPHGLSRLRAALAYDDEIAGGVLRLKYADRTDGVEAFARIMAGAGQELWAEGVSPVLIPVPLHRERLRTRRYNQAGLLATRIAQLTGHTVSHTTLRRTRKTAPQKGGSRSGRRANVAGAFAVPASEPVSGRPVVLIDDVLTTGATLLACARALRQAGVGDVSALTLARVIPSASKGSYVGEQDMPMELE